MIKTRGYLKKTKAQEFKDKVKSSAPTTRFKSEEIKRSMQGPANIGEFPQHYHSPSKLTDFEKKMRETHRKYGIKAKYGSR